MVPTLVSGDFVVSFSNLMKNYKTNEIVVVKHPTLGNIIKRVEIVDANNRVKLVGDNQEVSTSSSKIGWQDPKTILGRVIWHIGK